MTIWRVFDHNDCLCGMWYATTEISAINLARAEGYDAWSAQYLRYSGY